MPADTPAFFTVNELAARFSVTPITIRRLADSGELPAVRFGRVLRFDPADVDAYLARQRGAKRPAKNTVARRDGKTKQPAGLAKKGKGKGTASRTPASPRTRGPKKGT